MNSVMRVEKNKGNTNIAASIPLLGVKLFQISFLSNELDGLEGCLIGLEGS
jgi:hypothetical protein